MDALQTIINKNANLLLPTFFSTSTVFSGIIGPLSLLCFFRPHSFARVIGIPLPKSDSKSPATVKSQYDAALAYLIAISGREFSISLLLFTLSMMRETKALGAVMSALCFVGFGDAFAAWKYGEKGVWLRSHLGPTLCLGWVGPLGLMLARGGF